MHHYKDKKIEFNFKGTSSSNHRMVRGDRYACEGGVLIHAEENLIDDEMMFIYHDVSNIMIK